MKTIFFTLFVLTVLPMASQAGKLKDLILKVEDAIVEEMSENAGLALDEILDYQFKKVIGVELAVEARVLAHNPLNGEVSEYLCTVGFDQMNGDYEPVQVECEAP